MPTSTRETLLARYHYDSLDRLVDSTPFEPFAIQRYYCKTRLVTEIQGGVQRSIVQHDDQLLAQQQRESGKVSATLLATDQQRSVLNALDANQSHPLAYSPYGHRPIENGLLSLLGFNGERPDPVTGNYHLGNGYRQFNPVLMRFHSPDSWSPFGEGGLNAYVYCGGDPVNKNDPTGHMPNLWKGILNKLGRSQSNKTQALRMIKKQKTEITKLISNFDTEYGRATRRKLKYENSPRPDHKDIAFEASEEMEFTEAASRAPRNAKAKLETLLEGTYAREKNLDIEEVKKELSGIRKNTFDTQKKDIDRKNHKYWVQRGWIK